MSRLSKSLCLYCYKEMRKWISEDICYSMCVNIDCENNGTVAERDIQNINNFKMELKGMKLEKKKSRKCLFLDCEKREKNEECGTCIYNKKGG